MPILESLESSGLTTFDQRQDLVMRVVNGLAKEAHQIAKDHGFYDPEPEIPQRLMLMVSELSEALEADRHGNPHSEHIPDFSGIEEELADCIIRILDLAAHKGYNLGAAIVAKMKFNAARPMRHGGKRY